MAQTQLDWRPAVNRLFLWCVLTFLAAACDRVAPVTDANLERLPDYQRAKIAAAAGDYNSAISLYNRALRAAPAAGRVHLELGLLYDEKMSDPLAAIYHYRQYLALGPDPNKKQLVEDYVERARLSFASKLPQSSVTDPAELIRLQNENAALRARMAELEKTPAVPPPAPSPTTTPVSESVSRTYVIQKGDTLQLLALRYYGTRSAWEKIYAANRTTLASKDQLKVGQQLLIP